MQKKRENAFRKVSCHVGILGMSKWSKGYIMPSGQEGLNTQALIMFLTSRKWYLRTKAKHSHRLRDQITHLSWESIAELRIILNSLKRWWQPFQLIRVSQRARRGDAHVFPCEFVSPTMASTAFVSVLQATLLLASAAVSPPAVCLSGSTAEYQSVLTWHKSRTAVY